MAHNAQPGRVRYPGTPESTPSPGGSVECSKLPGVPDPCEQFSLRTVETGHQKPHHTRASFAHRAYTGSHLL